MSGVNVELLDQVMDKIREEAAKPKEESLWDQSWFSDAKPCGTAYCFAGWTVVLAGFKYESGLTVAVDWPETGLVEIDELSDYLLGFATREQVVSRRVGWDTGWARHLYQGSLSLSELEESVEFIKNSECEPAGVDS